jgi:hypothetical protein
MPSRIGLLRLSFWIPECRLFLSPLAEKVGAGENEEVVERGFAQPKFLKMRF